MKSEQCIGLLKGHFQWLKNIILFIQIAVILQNALINAPYDDSWIDEEFLELDDELNVALERE